MQKLNIKRTKYTLGVIFIVILGCNNPIQRTLKDEICDDRYWVLEMKNNEDNPQTDYLIFQFDCENQKLYFFEFYTNTQKLVATEPSYWKLSADSVMEFNINDVGYIEDIYKVNEDTLIIGNYIPNRILKNEEITFDTLVSPPPFLLKILEKYDKSF